MLFIQETGNNFQGAGQQMYTARLFNNFESNTTEDITCRPVCELDLVQTKNRPFFEDTHVFKLWSALKWTDSYAAVDRLVETINVVF